MVRIMLLENGKNNYSWNLRLIVNLEKYKNILKIIPDCTSVKKKESDVSKNQIEQFKQNLTFETF